MTKKRPINTVVCVVLFGIGVMLAQDPALNVDKNKHPNFGRSRTPCYRSERLHQERAAKNNRYDMHGHATKAEAAFGPSKPRAAARR